MKTVKLFICFFALLFCVQTMASQKKDSSQNRNVNDFSAIKVSSGIDLYLTQGNNEEVIVKADTDIIDNIITKVKNGVLHIYFEKNMHWVWTKSRQAFVTFDDLEALTVSAGSDVYSKNSFELESLKLDVSSGSDIKLEDLSAGKIMLETSSGSDAKLSGDVEFFKASASSGSDIDARDLKSRSCEVRVSSGSDAIVYVTERLDASASSGGDIRYKGSPREKDINESSGGDVYGY